MTLAEIDAALFASLAALEHEGTASPTRPFARVVRGWGPITQESLRKLAPQSPGLVLAWGGAARPQDLPQTATILEVSTADMLAAESWTILVSVEETRSTDDAVQGGGGFAGILGLVDATLGAVNGLNVAGTWQDRRAEVAGYGPSALSKPGVISVAEVRVTVGRVVPRATDPTPMPASAPLEEAHGDNGPPGDLFDHATTTFP